MVGLQWKSSGPSVRRMVLLLLNLGKSLFLYEARVNVELGGLWCISHPQRSQLNGQLGGQESQADRTKGQGGLRTSLS